MDVWWLWGQSHIFIRGRVRDENNIVYNNDSHKTAVNGEDEAYTDIREICGIPPLKLGYIPAEMIFF